MFTAVPFLTFFFLCMFVVFTHCGQNNGIIFDSHTSQLSAAIKPGLIFHFQHKTCMYQVRNVSITDLFDMFENLIFPFDE